MGTAAEAGAGGGRVAATGAGWAVTRTPGAVDGAANVNLCGMCLSGGSGGGDAGLGAVEETGKGEAGPVNNDGAGMSDGGDADGGDVMVTALTATGDSTKGSNVCESMRVISF